MVRDHRYRCRVVRSINVVNVLWLQNSRVPISEIVFVFGFIIIIFFSFKSLLLIVPEYAFECLEFYTVWSQAQIDSDSWSTYYTLYTLIYYFIYIEYYTTLPSSKFDRYNVRMTVNLCPIYVWGTRHYVAHSIFVMFTVPTPRGQFLNNWASEEKVFGVHARWSIYIYFWHVLELLRW